MPQNFLADCSAVYDPDKLPHISVRLAHVDPQVLPQDNFAAPGQRAKSARATAAPPVAKHVQAATASRKGTVPVTMEQVAPGVYQQG